MHIDWTWQKTLAARRCYFSIASSWRCRRSASPMKNGATIRWAESKANGTLGGEGCAVAAAAMVFKFYGVETDPQELNWFLTSVDGYTEQGWIYWDRAAWFAPDRVRTHTKTWPRIRAIDSNLAHEARHRAGAGCRAASRILSSSPARTGSTTSCAIPAVALRKASTRCASLAATSRGYDFTSRSRMRIPECTDERSSVQIADFRKRF